MPGTLNIYHQLEHDCDEINDCLIMNNDGCGDDLTVDFFLALEQVVNRAGCLSFHSMHQLSALRGE